MKVIAITGGGAGIGRGIAWHFARAGWAVSITDADRQAGKECLEVMRAAGTKAIFVPGDVSKPGDMERWLKATKAELGCPDVLVNNAGIEIRKDVFKLSIAEFDKVIAVNLRGTFICSQAVAKMMARRGPKNATERGTIINLASTRAFMSEAGTEGYTASKGGIVALTHGMAISLAPHRIRVNAIAPGWIETADWQKASKAKNLHHSKADREQHLVGRVGVPEDVAKACQFIAEDAGFMTGQTLTLDGGMTVKMIYA
ncbi:MAG: SDR family oxidoreductase [Alphaproteobacteria bacterium]|nr:SDR family oxidoreductase [Alphaproteobacteria bacterium]